MSGSGRCNRRFAVKMQPCASVLSRSAVTAPASLEDAFWSELIGICRERGITINALVAEVDHSRTGDGSNLSSALQIYILRELKKQHPLQGAGLLVV